MQIFSFIFLLLVTKLVTSEKNSSKDLVSSPPPIESKISVWWGAPCKEQCAPEIHIICRNSTCVCDSSFPVYLKQTKECSRGILLGEECKFDEQCLFFDKHAYCHVFFRGFRECDCRQDYEIKDIAGLKPPRLCFPALSDKEVPTFLGLGLGLSLMSAMICLALRIYARARFARPRRYANAAIPPPLTVSGTNDSMQLINRKGSRGAASDSELFMASPRGTLIPLSVLTQGGVRSSHMLRPEQIPRHTSLPGDRRETYAAFALTPGGDGEDSPIEYRPINIRSSSSRRTSYISMQPHRPSGKIYRLGSSSSIAANRPGSRRMSAASVKSFRSQSGLQLMSDLRPEPDHYIVYMIRRPSRSVGSDSTTLTNCESVSPRSTDQQNSPVEKGPVGKSHTTSSFRTISSEDVFEEEDEDEDEEEEEEIKNNEENRI